MGVFVLWLTTVMALGGRVFFSCWLITGAKTAERKKREQKREIETQLKKKERRKSDRSEREKASKSDTKTVTQPADTTYHFKNTETASLHTQRRACEERQRPP